MKMKNAIISLLAVSALSFGLAACEKKGPAEQAGEKIDNATEAVGEKIDNAAETAGEKTDNATETAGEKVDNAVDAVGEKLKEAGQDIQRAADDATK